MKLLHYDDRQQWGELEVKHVNRGCILQFGHLTGCDLNDPVVLTSPDNIVIKWILSSHVQY